MSGLAHDEYSERIPEPPPPMAEDEQGRFDAEFARATVESERLAGWRPHMLSAAQLQTMEFPPLETYIDGLVAEGLTIFGGKPKLGKSWFAMRAAMTIATGGVAFDNPARTVHQAPVLYLALEDGPSRLQGRINTLLSPAERWPAALQFASTWPRLDEGGIELLADAIGADGYRVVVVDTFARVRKPKGRGGDPYQEDSNAMAMIHDLTKTTPGLAVVVVHHNRKSDQPADYVDALSGTTGITGVPDHIAVLQRGRGEADAVLQYTSRDAPEHETAFAFRQGVWSELGSAALYAQSKERREILDELAILGGTATLSQLADLTGTSQPAALKKLRALQAEGLVHQDGERGPWNTVKTVKSGQTELTDLTENTDLTHLTHLTHTPEEPPDPTEPPPLPEDEQPNPWPSSY